MADLSACRDSDRMLAELVPPEIVVRAVSADLARARLFPAEAAQLGAVSARRRAEFATTRWCARQALTALEVTPAAILRDARGAPVWPRGVVGSMTHCAGYRAAAVARAGEVAGLGIDVDTDRPFAEGALDLIAGPAERDRIQQLGPDAAPWPRILFSAKEALYKALWPLTLVEVDLLEATVQLDAEGSFTARVEGKVTSVAELSREAQGRWAARDGFVAAAVLLRPSRPTGLWTPNAPRLGRHAARASTSASAAERSRRLAGDA